MLYSVADGGSLRFFWLRCFRLLYAGVSWCYLFDSTGFIIPDGSIVLIQFIFIQILLQFVMFYKHALSMF